MVVRGRALLWYGMVPPVLYGTLEYGMVWYHTTSGMVCTYTVAKDAGHMICVHYW